MDQDLMKYVDRILISEEEIQAKVKEMGKTMKRRRRTFFWSAL